MTIHQNSAKLQDYKARFHVYKSQIPLPI